MMIELTALECDVLSHILSTVENTMTKNDYDSDYYTDGKALVLSLTPNEMKALKRVIKKL